MTEVKKIADMNMRICVGFGEATLRKNGSIEVDGEYLNWHQQGVKFTVADAEDIAAKDPDHDWRIIIHAPLYGEIYQRQGPKLWVCIESNEGFA